MKNYSNNIAHSSTYQAFISRNGNTVVALKDNVCGALPHLTPFLNVKSVVVDLDFNPFLPSTLVTATYDKMVCIFLYCPMSTINVRYCIRFSFPSSKQIFLYAVRYVNYSAYGLCVCLFFA